MYAIAEGLTRDGILSPSQPDPARNRHRTGEGWNKGAVRAILMNPRYTGRQVWNKQRKDEVLLDVKNVNEGYETKLRWNDEERWVWSGQARPRAAGVRRGLRGHQEGPRRQRTRPHRTRAHAHPERLRFRAPVVRAVRAQDAGTAVPRQTALPVPLPQGLRAGQPRPAP